MIHFPGRWHAIRNTRGKKTEYFSSFCSLKIHFKWCFCYYNIDFNARSRYNFWGSCQVLWVFPSNVTKDLKVLRKSSYGCKGAARPFAAHCKKDMLEWLRVPLSPFAVISVVTQEKETMVTVLMCWSFFIIWRSFSHSWQRLKKRYESLRNVAMHFTLQK